MIKVQINVPVAVVPYISTLITFMVRKPTPLEGISLVMVYAFVGVVISLFITK
jgi:hypothetical protein